MDTRLGRGKIPYDAIGAAAFFVGAWILLTSTQSSFAQTQVPRELYGKTLRLTYSVHVTAKTPSGRIIPASRSTESVIYFSSEGRMFRRTSTRNNVGNMKKVERDPADVSKLMQFQGDRLVGAVRVLSGAVQLAISFVDQFKGCTADLIFGKEDARPFKWTGLNGAVFEAVDKPTVSNVACSIREGNAL